MEDPITFYKERIKDLEELNSSLKQIVSAKDYELTTVRRDAQTVVGQWREAAKDAEMKETAARKDYDQVLAKLQSAEHKLAAQQRQVQGNNDDINNLREKIKEEQTLRMEAHNEMTGMKLKMTVVEQDCFKAHERVNNLESMLENAGHKIKNQEQEFQRLQDQKEAVSLQLNTALTEVSKWKTDAVEATALVTTLRSEIGSLNKDIREDQEHLEGRINEIRALESQLKEYKRKHDELENKCSDYMEKVEEFQFLHQEALSKLELEYQKKAEHSEEMQRVLLTLTGAETAASDLKAALKSKDVEIEELKQQHQCQMSELHQQLVQLRRQNDLLKDDLQEARDDLITANKMTEELQIQFQASDIAKNEAESEKQRIAGLCDQHAIKIQNLVDDLSNLQVSLDNEIQKNQKLDLAVSTLQADSLDLGREKQALLSQLEVLSAETEALQKQVAVEIPNLKTEVERWKSSVSVNEMLVEKKNSENEKILKQIQNLEEKYILLTSQIANTNNALQQKQSECGALTETLNTERDSHQRTKAALASLKQEYMTLEASREGIAQKLERTEVLYQKEVSLGKVDKNVVVELELKLNTVTASLTESLNAHVTELEGAKERQVELERHLSEAKDEALRLTRIKDTLEADLSNITREKRRLHASLAMLENERAEEHHSVTDLKHCLADAVARAEEGERQLDAVKSKYLHLQAQSDKEKDQYHKVTQTFKEELLSKDTELRAVQQKLSHAEGEKQRVEVELQKNLKAKQAQLDQKVEELTVEQNKRAKLKQMFEEITQRCDQKNEMIDQLQNERDEVVRNHDGVVLKYNHLFEVYKELKKKSDITNTTFNTSAPLLSQPVDEVQQQQIQKLKKNVEELRAALTEQLDCCRVQQSEFRGKCEELRLAQAQLRVLTNRLTLASKTTKSVADPNASAAAGSRTTISGSVLSIQNLNTAEGQLRRPKKRESESQLTAPHHQKVARPVDMNRTI